MPTATFARAAQLIQQADALIVTAGAGMGVDSGLPDFRSNNGFWRAYPALGQLGISFSEAASPATFERDPHLAWGFYGHRLQLYRNTQPHAGFGLLQDWGATRLHGMFVFTSNVDGQFQKANYDPARLVEVHGSIHHLQCLRPCGHAIWSADALLPDIDPAACYWRNELPRCPHCGGLARPNILMFGDADWISQRQTAQMKQLGRWLSQVSRPVVIELGSGTTVTTVRHFGKNLLRHHGAHLIRINPTEHEVSNPDDVGLAYGALAGLLGIAAALQQG